MAMGRPNLGVDHVDKVNASEHAKQRLRVILRSLMGELSVQEACEILGVSRTRFAELRHQCLQGAADALAPGRPGRPPTGGESELEDLRFENAELKDLLHLQAVALETVAKVPEVAECLPKDWEVQLDDDEEGV